MSKSHQTSPNYRDKARYRAGLRVNQEDPTRTKSLRDQYAAQLRKRYRALAGAIRILLIDQDYLDLQDDGMMGQQARPGTFPVPDVPIPSRPQYGWPTDQARAQAFDQWLDNASDAVVLGPGTGRGNNRWTDNYVRYAYGRGVVHGNHRLRNAGYSVPDIELRDAFRTPIHRDTLGIFYERQYELLRGVNRQMGDRMSQTLTEGLLAGQGPRNIARDLTQTVQGVGLKRANTIARTEVIHTYTEGNLNRYEQILGSTAELQVVLEFATAGDSRVCEICQSLEASTYTVESARGVIPVHPNCRCAWLPKSRSQPS